MSEYTEKAEKFLKDTGTVFSVKFLKNDKYFPDDKDSRDIYEITLQRKSRKFTFTFGNSINCSGRYEIIYESNSYTGNKILHSKEELKKARGHYFGFGTFWKENKDFAEPTAYDVLATINKYDVGSFEDFCGEFGYDTDSRKAEGIYKAVVREYESLKMLYTDEELKELQEIN